MLPVLSLRLWVPPDPPPISLPPPPSPNQRGFSIPIFRPICCFRQLSPFPDSFLFPPFLSFSPFLSFFIFPSYFPFPPYFSIFSFSPFSLSYFLFSPLFSPFPFLPFSLFLPPFPLFLILFSPFSSHLCNARHRSESALRKRTKNQPNPKPQTLHLTLLRTETISFRCAQLRVSN